MDETLKDVVEVLLDDDEDSQIFVNNFLSFYNLTYYNKSHSLESRIYLTACCGYVYSFVCSSDTLRDTDKEIICRAYKNSILEILDAWRQDDENLLDKATKNALVLLTVWTERVQEDAHENLQRRVRVLTEFVGQIVFNPDLTLLTYACLEQTFYIEGKYREVLSCNSNVIKYILKNKIVMAQAEPSLLGRLVQESFRKWRFWTRSQKEEAAKCALILREHGRNENWEPTDEEIEFMQDDLFRAIEAEDDDEQELD